MFSDKERKALRSGCWQGKVALFLSFIVFSTPLAALTVQVGGGETLVEGGAIWRYFKGRSAPADPPDLWISPDFDDSSWQEGPSGFGYGDNDDATILNDMRNNYLTVYIRIQFQVGEIPKDSDLFLIIDYDDGFAAYLNGQEVARRHLPEGPLTYTTTASSHEAGQPETINLGKASDLLVQGRNVLAVEGHNTSLSSSDFSLLPVLKTGSEVRKINDLWVTTQSRIKLSGTVESSEAQSVEVNGKKLTYFADTKSFSGFVELSPGKNTLTVQALNQLGEKVEEEVLEVFMVPQERIYSGEITQDTTWEGAVILEAPVTVPKGVSLTVAPGTVVLCDEGTVIRVEGRIRAEGTEERPVLFTRYSEGSPWERILLWKAEEAYFRYCTFEYANSEGAHQDYYLPGPRNYHEAVCAIACQVTFENCTFQKLPDESANAEGDAIAIISDDPDTPGPASGIIRNCKFLSIGQGIHTRYSYILVEGCFFTGKRGDNDDVDLWGESDPPPVIRYNVFLNPRHDDMINPTKCSAIIVGNIIAGSDDHGIVLRDKGRPVVINNVIYDCRSAGIAVENTCDALLINNTIFDCGRGVRLLDLGRAGPPYYLTPGGGKATLINCIIWDCPTPISLSDSSNPDAEDRGSHVTVQHSLIQGGKSGVRISGSFSTLNWGEGNIDADPRFVDASNADFHLQPDSPAIDAGTSQQAPDRDIEGSPRPCGEAVDIGAYEFCASQPGMFKRADSNADGRFDISDSISILRYLFGAGGEPECKDAADVNDDGTITIADPIYLLGYLFAGGAKPPLPFPNCGIDPTEDSLTCDAYPACK